MMVCIFMNAIQPKNAHIVSGITVAAGSNKEIIFSLFLKSIQISNIIVMFPNNNDGNK